MAAIAHHPELCNILPKDAQVQKGEAQLESDVPLKRRILRFERRGAVHLPGHTRYSGIHLLRAGNRSPKLFVCRSFSYAVLHSCILLNLDWKSDSGIYHGDVARVGEVTRVSSTTLGPLLIEGARPVVVLVSRILSKGQRREEHGDHTKRYAFPF